MKSSTLRVLLATITLAMLGLVAIQAYWIHQASVIHRENFDQTARSALEQVVKRLEAREAYGYMKEQVNIDTDRMSDADLDRHLARKLANKQAVLGIEARNIDPDLAAAMDLKSVYGVYVDHVLPNTPAFYSGVQEGDIITEVGGSEVNSLKDIADVINQYKKGDQFTLSFERLDERKDNRYSECSMISHTNFIWRDKTDSVSYTYTVNMLNCDEQQVLAFFVDSINNLNRLIVKNDEDEKGTFITSYYGVDEQLLQVKSKEEFEMQASELSGSIVEEYVPFNSEDPLDTLVSGLLSNSTFLTHLSKEKDAIREVIISKQGQLVNTYHFVNDIVAEILMNEKSVKEKLAHFDLDEILSDELSCRGINMKPEWAVMDERSQMAFRSDSYDPRDQQTFRASLYPNDIFNSSQASMFVYFPARNSMFSFLSMGSMGQHVLSVATVPILGMVLIGLLIFCFYYIISTLLKQKKISELKTDFINNMTHELKTPVSTIKLAGEMIMDESVPPSSVKRYVGIIQEENRRLGDQIERVLQIARIERENAKLNFEAVNVHELLSEVMNRSLFQLEQKNGKLAANLDSTAPLIQADRVHLSNVLFNVLDNAVKYTPSSPNIEVSTEDSEEGLIISVKDNGIGMSKEVQKRIFEKFYRQPTGDLHDVKGFGLGLSYVKAMTEAHGGKVFVKSRPNQGSLFQLLFPRTEGLLVN